MKITSGPEGMFHESASDSTISANGQFERAILASLLETSTPMMRRNLRSCARISVRPFPQPMSTKEKFSGFIGRRVIASANTSGSVAW